MTRDAYSRREISWWPDRKKLVFWGEKPSPSFWDERWRTDNWKRQITSSRNSKYRRWLLQKYLPNTRARILEGGCGYGHLVDAMRYWGYQAIGVDYAEGTVRKINEIAPELDIRTGDVTSLEFEDEYFDGYWSLGVIEHFWEGYEKVLSEMRRVLRDSRCSSPFSPMLPWPAS